MCSPPPRTQDFRFRAGAPPSNLPGAAARAPHQIALAVSARTGSRGRPTQNDLGIRGAPYATGGWYYRAQTTEGSGPRAGR